MEATQQHKYEVWASNLLFLTFIISFISDLLLHRGYFAAHKSTNNYLTLFAANPFLLFVYYQIRKGTRGAKTLILALYALVVWHIVGDGISPKAYDTELEAFSLAAQHTSQIVACLLILLSLKSPKSQPVEA